MLINIQILDYMGKKILRESKLLRTKNNQFDYRSHRKGNYQTGKSAFG